MLLENFHTHQRLCCVIFFVYVVYMQYVYICYMCHELCTLSCILYAYGIHSNLMYIYAYGIQLNVHIVIREIFVLKIFVHKNSLLENFHNLQKFTLLSITYGKVRVLKILCAFNFRSCEKVSVITFNNRN